MPPLLDNLYFSFSHPKVPKVKVYQKFRNLTNEIAVVIRVPPDAPTAKRGTPLLSTNIEGVIEDIGRFPALIKLLSDGSTPKLFFLPGVEKSSISLL